MIPADTLNEKNCFSHFFVILILPLLFLGGLTAGYFGLLPLKVEIHTLIIISFIFITFAFFIKHNANYAVCKMRGSFGRMETDLQEALWDNSLTIMGETKSTLSIREFISEYYKSIRDDNFAKVAPSVFPMLGILGTFVAIALSMPDFTVKNLDALDHEITILLSGIGTAFYASIYGIFLSLLWIYFEKRGTAKADKNVYDLERLYNKRVWKRSELIKHEHQQSELKDQQIVETLKETFNLDFIKELNDQYLKNYKTIIDDTTNSFTLLANHMQLASKELRETLSLIQSREESINAVSQIKTNIEGFNHSAANIHKVIERFDDSLDHTFVKIDSEVGGIVEKLSEFALLISDQNREIQKSLKLQQLEKDKKSEA
jgi:hypothetical protein